MFSNGFWRTGGYGTCPKLRALRPFNLVKGPPVDFDFDQGTILYYIRTTSNPVGDDRSSEIWG